MFTPKLLKLMATGAVSLIVLGAVILGGTRGSQPVDENFLEPNSSQRIVVIDEMTEIIIEQWCMVCNERFYPEVSVFYREWYGKTRSQLQQILEDEYPGATLVAFFSDQVIVSLPPGKCRECSETRWPRRGYIGLVDNKMAVFTESGIVFEVIGDAPGAWIIDLEEGIPFESPEECDRLLINLTS